MKASRFAPIVVAAALTGMPAPSTAQTDDVRWLPFVGCWESVDSAEEAGLLCIRPDAAGVQVQSIVEGEVVATESLVGDGQRRPVVAEECDGWEAVSFSDDGRRAFTTSEFVCDEDERGGTGIMALISSNEWVDVRAMEIDGETVAWVQTYRLAGRDAMEEAGVDDPRAGLNDNTRAARQLAVRGVELDDVIEANNEVATEAVVAWLAAFGAEFDVNGADLVRLSDSGMPDEIIDVIVAVSNPDYFVVAPEQDPERLRPRRLTGRRIPVGIGYRSYLAFDPFYRYGYSPFGFGYRPYYGGYYGGFGYGRWGGYYPYTPIVTVRQQSDTRIIRGQGRTRGSSSGGSGRTAVRPGGGGGGGGASVGSSRGGSSSSGSGRTAVRRRGGSSSQMSSAAPSRAPQSSSSPRTARPRGIVRR